MSASSPVMDRDPLVERAIRLLQLGRPLPITFTVALMEQGVDIGELERKHAP